MKVQYRYVEAVDTLTFRGNRLFGAPGSYGDARFPPGPSVLAGAFRSLLLTKLPREIGAFTQGKRLSAPVLDGILGTPADPGSFTVTQVGPARKMRNGKKEPLLPLPADLIVTGQGETVQRLEPQPLPTGIKTGQPAELPCIPVLRQGKQTKPENGWLLTDQGIHAYLQGESVGTQHLLKADCLWRSETRVGIGMSSTSRSAEQGKLFSVEHTALMQAEHGKEMGGLIVGIAGCDDLLPESGLLRLGGDGRVARFEAMHDVTWNPPLEQIGKQGRFKLILHTPGLFQSGWLPDGVNRRDGGYWLELGGLKARLACAAVSRYEVVSGWDLARWHPKDAQRAAPAGSVYWFDQVEGDPGELRKLAESGLWSEPCNNQDKIRRAEGYGRVLIGAW
jgi:CRISPR-associated protein Cmr3